MFEFGKNWLNYNRSLNENKIVLAQKSLQDFFGINSFKNKKLLDAGSGSGLFSLAARNLGAEVVSFDVDAESVVCTKSIKNKFYPRDTQWKIVKGSLLNSRFINSLGTFDYVYCWGVAHHTGNMITALENLVPLCNIKGYVYLAIYNDQRGASIRWRKIKYLYNRLPTILKPIYESLFIIYFESISFIQFIKILWVTKSVVSWKNYSRGMNRWNDYIDWIGGYPFEVAKPEVIFDFYRARNFELIKIKTCGGSLGNNEYLFKKKK